MTEGEPRWLDLSPLERSPDSDERRKRRWLFVNWMQKITAPGAHYHPATSLLLAPDHLQRYLVQKNLSEH
jgi:hypothetical protein